jgi:ketosteroid isomerase-like protein
MKPILPVVVLACGLLAGACSTSSRETSAGQTSGGATVSSTADILARHQKTFGASDLEGVLADYAPDAVMFTPTGPIQGTDALRKTFQTLFAEWGKPGTKFEMKKQTVEGAYAYTFWAAETADNVYEAGTDAFVVANGKIVAHFFSAKITPKH